MARSSGRRGGGSHRRRASRPPTNRHYPRTARLNTLIQQIVADHLERIDDDRLGFLTVTGVEVDNDLNKAEVFISRFEDSADPQHDQEGDEAYLEILAEYRKPLQAQIAAQSRIRKTPEVVFAFDPGVRAGARIEHILSGLDLPPDAPVDADADGGATNRGEPEAGIDGAAEPEER